MVLGIWAKFAGEKRDCRRNTLSLLARGAWPLRDFTFVKVNAECSFRNFVDGIGWRIDWGHQEELVKKEIWDLKSTGQIVIRWVSDSDDEKVTDVTDASKKAYSAMYTLCTIQSWVVRQGYWQARLELRHWSQWFFPGWNCLMGSMKKVLKSQADWDALGIMGDLRLCFQSDLLSHFITAREDDLREPISHTLVYSTENSTPNLFLGQVAIFRNE